MLVHNNKTQWKHKVVFHTSLNKEHFLRLKVLKKLKEKERRFDYTKF